MKDLKEFQGYKPYEYKCKSHLIIDPRTGIMSSFNPRSKHNK
jgi:hypothetical protein